jgi:P-type Cu2+ transporter
MDEHAGHEQQTATDHSGHSGGGHDHSEMVADFRRRFFVSLALTVPIIALSEMVWMLFGLMPPIAFPGDDFVVLVLSTIVWAWGGWPFLTGFVSEVRSRKPGMMTLVAVAISVAYFYSVAVVFGLPGDDFFWEMATLVVIMLLGHWLEMRSVMGASRALESLVRLMPAEAHLLAEDGSTTDVPVSELEPGDRVQVRPGEKVPVDGTVVRGETTIDESLLTGESEPVTKGEGDEVIGGSVNAEGSISVEVTRTGADSYLASVIELVSAAQESRSRTQDLADRAAAVLTLIALSAGALTMIAWSALSDAGFTFALERSVTVMVIACPHALGLAIPLVVAVSTSIAARGGLLVRDRSAFETARLLDAVVFDKTGTLTEGRFGVNEVVALGEWDADEVAALASAVEAPSQHPIARAITEHATPAAEVEGFSSVTGKGATGRVDGREVVVASPGYLAELGHDAPEETASLAEEGMTVVYVVVEGALAGAIALADVVRPESAEAVKRLHEMGVQDDDAHRRQQAGGRTRRRRGRSRRVLRRGAAAREVGEDRGGARARVARGDGGRRRQRRTRARDRRHRHRHRRGHRRGDGSRRRRARAQRPARRRGDRRALGSDLPQDAAEPRLGDRVQRHRHPARGRRARVGGRHPDPRGRRGAHVSLDRDRCGQRAAAARPAGASGAGVGPARSATRPSTACGRSA